jgi:hypothetical protein
MLQIKDRHQKADAVHTITVLECEQYVAFILRSDVIIEGKVINNDGKGRGMR